MQPDYTRYAIYWVPRQNSALADFGAGWTGWCADRGDIEDRPELRQLTKGRKGVPGDVALHGMHANIKSPFVLADGGNIWTLRHALARLAARLPAIALPRFEVTVFDGQVVLALTRPSEAVVSLLRDVAEVVLPYQTQPTYGLGPIPASRDWGSSEMPMIERFHMPLTDHLELGVAYDVVAELKTLLDPILREEQTLLDLALVADPGGRRPWRLIERYTLSERPASSQRPVPSGMACEGPTLITSLTEVMTRGHSTLIA